MKINIWSDIRCPFCYIGKRKFELALEQFQHKDKVEVIWRSFQLDPGLKTQPETNVLDYLAKIKGITREQAGQMHEHVKEVAQEVGLTFNFEKSVLANSLNGHRLIQLAKANDLGDVAEELLFKAHFTDGKNIDDPETLLRIGTAIGLVEQDVRRVLRSDDFKEEVKADELLGRSIGIRGVPFFIFNDKYALSGAQSPEIFLQTLRRAWADFATASPVTSS